MNIRKNLNTLSADEVAALKRAFAQAYVADDAYEPFAGIHGLPDPISCPHHTPDLAFLPWHREYLLQFEAMLQRFEPAVVLPYWDWSEDPSDTADGLPALFQPEPDGDGENQNPLFRAPMRWVPELIEQIGDQLPPETLEFLGEGWSLRAVSPPESRHDAAGFNLRALAAAAEMEPSIEEFNDVIEQPHDGLHFYIGHHMAAVPTASFDPIFWLHHCNVDRQWARWQALHPEANSHPSPDATSHDLSDRPFSELLDSRALGYDYDDLAPLREPVPQPMAAFRAQAARRVPTGRRLVLENLRQPGNRSFTLRFFKSARADERTPTRGNPDFLGEIPLFGHGPELSGGGGHDHHHGHAPQRPFRRQLLLPSGLEVDPARVSIVATDWEGRLVPSEQIVPEPPVLR